MRNIHGNPLHENLILPSNGCDYPAIAVFRGTSNTVCTGARLLLVSHEYHAGWQQAFSKYSFSTAVHLEIHRNAMTSAS